MRIFALGGVVAPIVFVTITGVVGALRDYSHVHQFVSELGATGTPFARVMNYLGFLPAGLLFVAFAVSTRALAPGRGTAAAGGFLLGVFAVGVVTAGLASCDPGCPQGSGTLANIIHDRVSPLAFMSAIGGIALFGVSFRKVSEWTSLSRYSLLSAAVSLVFMLLLVRSLGSREMTGLWQRLFLATVFTWCAIVGIRLYVLTGRDQP